jgi:hypothetical protein
MTGAEVRCDEEYEQPSHGNGKPDKKIDRNAFLPKRPRSRAAPKKETARLKLLGKQSSVFGARNQIACSDNSLLSIPPNGKALQHYI